LFWALLPARILVFLTVLVDDLRGLHSGQKLLGEVWLWNGLRSGVVPLDQRLSGPALVGLPLTIAWLIGCTNAVNLIDGVDAWRPGVASSPPSPPHRRPPDGELQPPTGDRGFDRSTARLPAVQLNPASIFLGDSGSLPIGFLLGCYGIVGARRQPRYWG